MGAIAFRWDVVASGFARLALAPGDGRLQVFLHEHWLRVLAGRERWDHLPMLHPATGLLGYTDAGLLDTVVYAPLRGLGLDPFVAYQTTWLVQSLLGFGGFALVCRRLLGTPRWVAIVAAWLFTFAGAYHATTPQAHLFAVYYLPWLVLGVAWALATARVAPARGAAGAAMCAALFALLFATAYYVAWLATIAGAVFVLARVAAGGAWPRVSRAGVGRVPWPFLGGALAGFVLGLVPFVLIYLPAVAEGRTRTFADAFGSLGTLPDLVNPGAGNLLWGALLERLPGYPGARLHDPNAFRTITPLVLVTALAAAATLRRGRDRATTLALLATLVVLLCLPLRIGPFTPWRLVWDLVPGARAVRLVWRLQLINVAVATCLVAVVLATLARAPSRAAHVLAVGLAATLLVEQLSRDDWGVLDLARERAELAAVPAPPAQCRAFVLTDEVGVVDTPNTFAMTLAHRLGMPTVNGYTGFTPDGWELYRDPRLAIRPAATVLAAAGTWLREHDALAGVCRYDLPSRAWTADPFRGWWAIDAGTTIEFGAGGTGDRYTLGRGWSPPGAASRWTEGPRAELAFELGDGFAEASQPVVHLLVGAFLFGPLQEQRVDVELDGRPAARWRFTPTDAPRWETIPLPARGDGRVRLTFHNRTPTSPASVGFNADPRRLGLSLARLRVEPR
ncbi:MAG: hypothetical protein KIT14_06310 [bacterium]|nr:hypothetical protein [bacterium]